VKTWLSAWSIGVREVTDREYEKYWRSADWQTRFTNDLVRADAEWDKLMGGK
jgi:hypothetical protein